MAVAVPRLPERRRRRAHRARHEGRAEADRARDRRAARRPDHRRSSRRPSAACCASSSWCRPACRSSPATSVMEFDPADQQYALEQAKSELAEAEQEIVKMKADAAVQKAQDDVALLTARFDVRRARAGRVGQRVHRGAIDAQKNVLSLEEAQAPAGAARGGRQVARRHQPGVAGRVGGEAQQGAARDAARAAGHRQPGAARAARRRRVAEGEPRRRRRLLLRAGAAGVPRRAIRSGPGRPVADVIESGRMEVRAKVDENDRGNLTAGQRRRGLRRRAARARRSRHASARCRGWPAARTGSKRQRQPACSTSRSSSTSPTRG